MGHDSSAQDNVAFCKSMAHLRSVEIWLPQFSPVSFIKVSGKYILFVIVPEVVPEIRSSIDSKRI